MQWTSWLEAIRRSCAPSVTDRRRNAVRNEPVEALEARALLTVTSFFINGQLSVASDGLIVFIEYFTPAICYLASRNIRSISAASRSSGVALPAAGVSAAPSGAALRLHSRFLNAALAPAPPDRHRAG